MPGLDMPLSSDASNKMVQILNYRQSQRTDDLCYENSKRLQPFKKEVFSYQFKDKPNYSLLRTMLEELKQREQKKYHQRNMKNLSKVNSQSNQN